MQNLQYFCLFVNPPRVGHSIVATLLNAHPNVAISHKAGTIVDLLKPNVTDKFVYKKIINHVKKTDKLGRKESVQYTYNLPGTVLAPLKSKNIIVVGDKHGESVVRLLQGNNELGRINKKLNVPLFVLQIFRNPYDNIASICLNNKQRKESEVFPIGQAAQRYFAYCHKLSVALAQYNGPRLTLYHEDIVKKPQTELGKICKALGLNASVEYLNVCQDNVWEKTNLTRNEINYWPQKVLDYISAQKGKYPFLARYNEWYPQ